MSNRRTRAQMRELDLSLIHLLLVHAPATVRQIFYLATTQGLIEKTEKAYKRVCERLKALRLEGLVAWDQITDLTRWQRKPLTFNNLETAVEHTRQTYRRAVWNGLDRRVFIVLEKEALAGVVGAVTYEFDVALLVTKGFASLTFKRGVAEDIMSYARVGIRTYVYALARTIHGDRDLAPGRRHRNRTRSRTTGNEQWAAAGTSQPRVAGWLSAEWT